jgi:hypothetical protein
MRLWRSLSSDCAKRRSESSAGTTVDLRHLLRRKHANARFQLRPVGKPRAA